VIALAADLAAHASLASVSLQHLSLGAPGALDAVVDAVLARRLWSVTLRSCHLSPASAPALARLLGGDTLTELHIDNAFEQLLDAPAAALVANALRANTSLTVLLLAGLQLWHDAAAVAELMGALTGHPRLRVLNLSWNWPHNDGVQAAEAGVALAALLLANAPALQTLDIHNTHLDDEGMGPVVEALRHNTHLTKLDCSGNDLSEKFARDELLPAVRANTRLRELVAGRSASERDAEALVAARTQPL
jgi:Ran GTPase-activating protein (RanGAP) involved in mRNA processing and transport